ncbi:MAG: hypothetical protein AAF211_03830 [Myxococcota bacterium]
MNIRFILPVVLTVSAACSPRIVGEWDVRTLQVELADSDVGVRGEDGRLDVDDDFDATLELTFDDADDYGYTIDLAGTVEDDGDGDYTLDLEGDIDAGAGAFDYAGRIECTVESTEMDCAGDLDAQGAYATVYGYYSQDVQVETTLKITLQRR